MRAVVLDAFGFVSVHDRPVPVPARDEVLVRVAAAGICGSDVHGFTGQNGRRHPGQVMGHEFSGTISQFGAEEPVGGLHRGQAVTANPLILHPASIAAFGGREQHAPDKVILGVHPERDAAFADYIAVPVRNVVPLPPGVPLEHGALAEPLAVAVHAVNRSGARPGDRVLVVGGGPIGQSLVVALRWRGIEDVIVTEPVPARRNLVESLGARTADPRDGPVAEAVTSSFGLPADVAIDAVGVTESLADALAATRLGGVVCLVGMASPRLEIDAFAVSTAERTIVGSFTYSAEEFGTAVRSLADPSVRLSTLISERVGPERAQDAFHTLAGPTPAPGKILIDFAR